jgi:glycosyltransferase involved in cell wall biosynthesis
MKTSICVVAPSYNHEQFIQQCIESIVNQSGNDYELDLILIDDASTDDTVKIAKKILQSKEIKRNFRKLDFIENKVNKGAHANYNKAVALTKADVIHFMNTDDWIESNRISSVVAAYRDACENGEGENFWGFGKVLLVDQEDLPITGDGFWQYLTHVVDYSVRQLPSASFHLLRDNLTISTGNIFASSMLAKKLGGFNAYKYVHDWDFALRCILLSEPNILNTSESEYMYRHHPGNSFRKLGHIGHLESFEVLYRYFSNTLLRHPLNKKVFSTSNYGITIVKAFLAENPAHKEIAGKVTDLSFVN